MDNLTHLFAETNGIRMDYVEQGEVLGARTSSVSMVLIAGAALCVAKTADHRSPSSGLRPPAWEAHGRVRGCGG